MCGLPGYYPGDLIDFELSGDTIKVTFSAGMDRPLRLTSPEATGLLLALRALSDIPGVVDPAAARSAIAKIEAATGAAQGPVTVGPVAGRGDRPRRDCPRGDCASGDCARGDCRRRCGPGGRARPARFGD